jgi:hypothetical protein
MALGLQRGSLSPRALGASNFRYVKDYFRAAKYMAVGGGPAGGTDASQHVLFTGNPFGVTHEFALIGTQTILGPIPTTAGGGGLDVSLDNAVDEGIEIVFGADLAGTARGQLTFTIGTDKPFFAKAKIYVTDVSGITPLYFGFRKAQAYQATFTDYTDYAALGLIDVTGNIYTETDNDNAGAVQTDSTIDWADATARTLEVRVNGAAVSYFVDGARVRAAPAFSFDDADVVVPFFRYVNVTDVGAPVVLVGDGSFEIGLQAQFGSFEQP